MCEQLAQSRYLIMQWPGVEPMRPLDHKSDTLTTTPPGHPAQSSQLIIKHDTSNRKYERSIEKLDKLNKNTTKVYAVVAARSPRQTDSLTEVIDTSRHLMSHLAVTDSVSRRLVNHQLLHQLTTCLPPQFFCNYFCTLSATIGRNRTEF